MAATGFRVTSRPKSSQRPRTLSASRSREMVVDVPAETNVFGHAQR